jgi:hypothetical protein
MKEMSNWNNHLINPIYRVDVTCLSGTVETEFFLSIERAVAHVASWREDLEDNPDSVPVGGIHFRIVLEETISYQIVDS